MQVVIKTLRNLALSKMFLEKQPFPYIKKSRSEKCLKIRRKAQKAPVQEFHFNTTASLQPATLLKKETQETRAVFRMFCNDIFEILQGS